MTVSTLVPPAIARVQEISIEDLRTNPALLKLDLYCKGARISEALSVEHRGGRKVLRTRAGLGSGLELILPHGLWTNVPVAESFAKQSPWEVLPASPGANDDEVDLYREGAFIVRARLSPRPSWYDKRTSSGRPMPSVGTLQGTYLGIYPGSVCEFWTRDEKSNCHFCSVGLNLGADDSREKTIDDILEVIRAAREESRITYVDLNAGHAEDESFLDLLEPIVERVKRETGLLIGIQAPPHKDLSRYDRLRKLGCNRVSFCFELFDPVRFKEVCPGKASTYGLKRYLDAIRYCAQLKNRRDLSREPWVTNGELVAGLEDPTSTIAGIDWLVERGAVPTVCVFRPLSGTDYSNVEPPCTEDLVPVFRHLFEECAEHGLPIGIAPNVHVSLVMLPEECRFLSDRRGLRAAWQLKRTPQSLAAKLWLWQRAERARSSWLKSLRTA